MVGVYSSFSIFIRINSLKIDYKKKYSAQQQSIKNNYATFEVPYNGKDNNDYVDGKGFCCNDAPANAPQKAARANDNPELYQYYYHPDHLGSSSFITNLDGDVAQHIEYVPYGEVFIEERNNTWNTPYLFNAKELDEETGLYYYGARYYEPKTSLWISVDPLAEKKPWLTSYHYCSNNPVNRIDPNGLEDHVDDYGNVIARYENNDKSIYMHKVGTTQKEIDDHRKDNKFDANIGEKIGELGSNIDVSTIMKNKLSETSKEATGMGMIGYFKAVKPKGRWDLKANQKTIFGIAWNYDKQNKTKTTFSFLNYSNMSAADVGNYHAGYAGRYTTILRYNLLKGAGAAETFKSFMEGRIKEGFGRLGQLLNPFNEQSGDRPVDYRWNVQGMSDASYTIMLDMDLFSTEKK